MSWMKQVNWRWFSNQTSLIVSSAGNSRAVPAQRGQLDALVDHARLARREIAREAGAVRVAKARWNDEGRQFFLRSSSCARQPNRFAAASFQSPINPASSIDT